MALIRKTANHDRKKAYLDWLSTMASRLQSTESTYFDYAVEDGRQLVADGVCDVSGLPWLSLGGGGA